MSRNTSAAGISSLNLLSERAVFRLYYILLLYSGTIAKWNIIVAKNLGPIAKPGMRRTASTAVAVVMAILILIARSSMYFYFL